MRCSSWNHYSPDETEQVMCNFIACSCQSYVIIGIIGRILSERVLSFPVHSRLVLSCMLSQISSMRGISMSFYLYRPLRQVYSRGQMEQGVPVGTPLRFLLQAGALYDKLNSFPLRKLADRCSGCYRCTVPISWDQQDEQNEDNQEYYRPSGVSSKCSVHDFPPFSKCPFRCMFRGLSFGRSYGLSVSPQSQVTATFTTQHA
jgi:hypothetical protein